MFDFAIDSIHTLIKNGFTLTSAGAILFLLLKQRKMRRRLKQYMPFLFADEEVNSTYVQNQLIIMKALGVEPCQNGQGSQRKHTQTNLSKLSISLWGEMKMRNYLRKLGRTKFQVLIASLIVNGVSAYLFLSGTLDLDGVLNTWMPIINLTTGTISTWVYIFVEGGIDKANAQGGNTNSEIDFTQETGK